MSLVTHIVSNMNVGATNGQVLRRVRRAMKKSVRRDPALREFRKAAYLEALQAHQDNRALYQGVMGLPADYANMEQIIARHLEGHCLSNCICKEG